MENPIQAAVAAAAERAGIVDVGLVTLPAFADILAGIKNAEDAPAALVKMRALKPNLFQAWDEMDDATFAQREEALLEGVRGRTGPRPFEFHEIDCSRLDAEELAFVDASLRASSRGDLSSIDRGRLTRLLAVQRNENALVKGAA
jgi:hypothetical protein